MKGGICIFFPVLSPILKASLSLPDLELVLLFAIPTLSVEVNKQRARKRSRSSHSAPLQPQRFVTHCWQLWFAYFQTLPLCLNFEKLGVEASSHGDAFVPASLTNHFPRHHTVWPLQLRSISVSVVTDRKLRVGIR